MPKAESDCKTTEDGQNIQTLQHALCWTPAPPNLNVSARMLPKVMLGVWFFSSIGEKALQVTLTLNSGGEGVVPDRRGLNISSIYVRTYSRITRPRKCCTNKEVYTIHSLVVSNCSTIETGLWSPMTSAYFVTPPISWCVAQPPNTIHQAFIPPQRAGATGTDPGFSLGQHAEAAWKGNWSL